VRVQADIELCSCGSYLPCKQPALASSAWSIDQTKLTVPESFVTILLALALVARTASLSSPCPLPPMRCRAQMMMARRQPQTQTADAAALYPDTEPTVELVGSTTAQHVVRRAGEPNGLAAFLQSDRSDVHLLNDRSGARGREPQCASSRPSFEGPSSSGLYTCDQPPISMLGINVLPCLTLSIERASGKSEITIHVVDAVIRVQRGSSPPWELDGLAINSRNVVAWGEPDAEGVSTITSELTLRVAMKLPRTFLLPPKAVARAGSLVLKQVCAAQCTQFLRDISAAYESAHDSACQRSVPPV